MKISLLPASVFVACFLPLCPARGGIEVRVAADAPKQEQLAAKEVTRYLCLRTGKLPANITQIGTVVVSTREAAMLTDATVRTAAAGLEAHQFVLKTTVTDGKKTWWIVGGDAQGALYGAYRFAEKLGARFYLHGDVIPDERLAAIPDIEETGKPIFPLRGVNPWGSHPFGFDAWSSDDYKAVITQLAKMRMNFIGIHCYPEGRPYAEPTVWHGLAGDFDEQGRVKTSYVARYYNTLITTAWGGYRPMKTGDYSLGGALLFEDDAWMPEVMRGHCPLPVTPGDCNDVFNRTGTQFHEAFTFARQLGVKTCIGTETPLILPKNLAARSTDARAIYEATFRRIMVAHPLDYFWLWTPEGWTWEGNKPEQYAATIADVRTAIRALKDSGAPFRLATCGWVLGPQHDRAALDNDLPKDIPMSGISRGFGTTEVDPAFARISGREKWAIPWLEGDSGPGLAGVQLWAGRMRRDAMDAREYGCTGLMGLQWRTEILSPNASALAQAAWNQDWQVAANKDRSLPVGDYYADWAQANFGFAQAGKVFAAIDGKVPAVTKDGCPSGSLAPIEEPWEKMAARFAFVDELEKLRTEVEGAGNLDRFDYWLNTFSYLRALMKTRCAMGAKQPDEVLKAWTTAYTCLLASVNSPGALAMVVNMENHPGWGPAVAESIGKPFPKDYAGKPRLIVPTVRSLARQDETIHLKIIALARQPVRRVTVKLRRLGGGDWQDLPARHVARATYSVELPPLHDDVEYHITAETADGRNLVWPATAPALNQTIVTMP